MPLSSSFPGSCQDIYPPAWPSQGLTRLLDDSARQKWPMLRLIACAAGTLALPRESLIRTGAGPTRAIGGMTN